MAKSRVKKKISIQNKKLVLYKYLKTEFARRLMYNGEVYIGTLSYYREIEDESRADRDEGKHEVVTVIDKKTTIENKDDWEKKASHFKGSNISYVSGTVIFNEGTHSQDRSIQDNYIYCMSKKLSSELKIKFEADSIIKIIDVQGFLSAIDDELARLGLVYPKIGSGGPIKYIGHQLDNSVEVSGNWLKKDSYKDEAEFRFSFIPIFTKDGKRIEPKMHPNGSVDFDISTPNDELKIVPISIFIKDIKRFCTWL